MNINTTYTKIITDEDLMEAVQHGFIAAQQGQDCPHGPVR